MPNRNADLMLLSALLVLYALVGLLMFASSRADAQGDVIYCTDGETTWMQNAPHLCPPGSWQV